ncbi:hypothetical protein ACFE04_029958 [Oxalis oulophora]
MVSFPLSPTNPTFSLINNNTNNKNPFPHAPIPRVSLSTRASLPQHQNPLNENKVDGGQLRLELVPRHVAVIMDGNRRWARLRDLPLSNGYEAGVRSLRGMMELCCKFGIRVLTVFAFSTDNWFRPQVEVEFLMNLFQHGVKEDVEVFASFRLCRMVVPIFCNDWNMDLNFLEFLSSPSIVSLRTLLKNPGTWLMYYPQSRLSSSKENIRISVIGDPTRLPETIQESIIYAEEKTKMNTGFQLIVAISYNGRYDLVQACQKIATKVKDGIIEPNDINNSTIEQELETNCTEFPNPDLLIRTSGELRVSNFLLWQLAYTELFFSPLLWPDFGEAEFLEALISFQHRQRRFGE